ncbi:MAG TPA: pyridoxamine 5'-phosphate oxidase family protein, partial [Desulfobulbus sp.]|nr:pyridoxamine 5'-phosphate oxidase family protein [Desulfobulbus sp.]
MNLKEYFSENKGIGIMATSDAEGVVDTAVYSRPHIMEDNIAAFIMRDRLTHKNLGENGNAGFLFIEGAKGYSGVRLFMTKIDETEDHELITSLTRRHLSRKEDAAKGKKFLVRFRVNKVLQLIG